MNSKKGPPFAYLITEGELTNQNYKIKSEKVLRLTEIAVKKNISAIQIREKKLGAGLIFRLVSEILKITENSTTKVLVNDRFDIALASGADGVHLTSNSIPVKVVRNLCGSDLIIGASTHSLKKAKQAQFEGADFVTFSPIFYTKSKGNFGKPRGLKELKRICRKLESFPVIALGGINPDNFSKTLENGAAGFASISFLNDPEKLKNIKL